MTDNRNTSKLNTFNGKVLSPFTFFVVNGDKANLHAQSFLVAKGEVIKRKEVNQSEGVKRIVTNNGISDIFLNLALVNKHVEEKREFLDLVHTTAKGNEIRIMGKDGKQVTDIIKSNMAAALVYLFLLYKLSWERKRHFQFDLNEYFDFYKMERRTEGVRQLEKGLEFLAHMDIHFKGNYKGKNIVGTGTFLAYNIVREGKQNRNYVSISLMDWSKPIIENLQYMLMDEDILEVVDRQRFPKINTIIYTLYNRFRNNVHKRKGKDQEVISVRSLIFDGLGVTKQQLKKRGYADFLFSLERHLHHLEELGYISWHYENRKTNSSNLDWFQDNVIYQIKNEVINKKYAEIAKSRGRKGKVKK